MDPIVLGSLIGAGSNVLNNAFGFLGQQQTNSANMQLAKYQNELLMQNWREQNEYNSPAATMQRLTEAGINPRAYGQIGQFANAGQTPNTPAPEYKSPLSSIQVYTDILSDALNLQRQMRENENLKVQNRLLTSQADHYDALSKLNSVKVYDTELNYALQGLGYNVIDPKTGKPYDQFFGYTLNPKDRGWLLSKDHAVSRDAASRALYQYYMAKQAEEDTENAFFGNGVDSIAKGLIRNSVRFGRWTWQTWRKSQKK